MYKLLISIFIIILAASVSFAQDNDVLVGKTKIPDLNWGNQKISIQLTNNTDWVKFIVVETDIDITGTYFNPVHRSRSNHILEPEQTTFIEAAVYIPGTFGNAEIVTRLYDVVDTLDEILDGQLFYEKSAQVSFTLPEGLKSYFQTRLFLPPRVEEHPYFKSNFTRVLFILLNEGKTISEIAQLANSDTTFIVEQLQLLNKNRYLNFMGNIYTPNFPIITAVEARATEHIVEQTAIDLSATIAENYKGYWTVIDSLTANKIIPRDSSDFISGASLMYKPYPVISALLMWYDLGNKFITRSAPLLLFDGTDLCNASNYQYYYAVYADEKYIGTHLFYYHLTKKKYSIIFSETPPPIECEENFLIKGQRRQKATWKYTYPQYPEYFIIDSSVVRPLLSQLDAGTQVYLESAYRQLLDISKQFGHKGVSYGYRYWFWNLVAEKTLAKLIDNGVIERRGTGYYRFDSLTKKKQNK